MSPLTSVAAAASGACAGVRIQSTISWILLITVHERFRGSLSRLLKRLLEAVSCEGARNNFQGANAGLMTAGCTGFQACLIWQSYVVAVIALVNKFDHFVRLSQLNGVKNGRRFAEERAAKNRRLCQALRFWLSTPTL